MKTSEGKMTIELICYSTITVFILFAGARTAKVTMEWAGVAETGGTSDKVLMRKFNFPQKGFPGASRTVPVPTVNFITEST